MLDSALASLIHQRKCLPACVACELIESTLRLFETRKRRQEVPCTEIVMHGIYVSPYALALPHQLVNSSRNYTLGPTRSSACYTEGICERYSNTSRYPKLASMDDESALFALYPAAFLSAGGSRFQWQALLLPHVSKDPTYLDVRGSSNPAIC